MADSPAGVSDLVFRLDRLPQLVNGDAALVRRGRWVSLDFLLELGDAPYHITIAEGRIAALQRGPLLMGAWRFAVRGSAEGWRRFWQPVPEPQWHDLFALTKRGAFRIEGDLQPLMANLFYFKDVLAAPRRIEGTG